MKFNAMISPTYAYLRFNESVCGSWSLFCFPPDRIPPNLSEILSGQIDLLELIRAATPVQIEKKLTASGSRSGSQHIQETFGSNCGQYLPPHV
jgi:hypothetical protein